MRWNIAVRRWLSGGGLVVAKHASHMCTNICGFKCVTKCRNTHTSKKEVKVISSSGCSNFSLIQGKHLIVIDRRVQSSTLSSVNVQLSTCPCSCLYIEMRFHPVFKSACIWNNFNPWNKVHQFYYRLTIIKVKSMLANLHQL